LKAPSEQLQRSGARGPERPAVEQFAGPRNIAPAIGSDRVSLSGRDGDPQGIKKLHERQKGPAIGGAFLS
jgi:hypothetical protein